ncbi:ExbD/TolR family protein [Oligosphaera ethanolica]|uniref:Biopolymer transport protein ExbD n=1 Tax=Oligosphaera ethanolica TaxID=760260 RepID=A0AAE4API9_9BACT|nr:biopolymer transporter ExbD [Oligosphaera ethanolica]MDQ0289452.1 biopolymer transport protein ExbD [Oligosphaera ethanolica]
MPRRRTSRVKLKSEIDITPLMDLTFMLLIIFVITVPVLEYSTKVDATPPELNNKQNEASAKDQSVVIHLTREGQVLYFDQKIQFNELDALFSSLRAQRPNMSLLIRADGARPYEDVIAIMRAAKHANVETISLVTQAERVTPGKRL